MGFFGTVCGWINVGMDLLGYTMHILCSRFKISQSLLLIKYSCNIACNSNEFNMQWTFWTLQLFIVIFIKCPNASLVFRTIIKFKLLPRLLTQLAAKFNPSSVISVTSPNIVAKDQSTLRNRTLTLTTTDRLMSDGRRLTWRPRDEAT